METPDRRMPPANIEAEEGVLGAVLLDNAVLPDLVRILGPADFFRDSHQVLWRAIMVLFATGAPVTIITLGDELERQGNLRAAGGIEALASLLGNVPHSANAVYHAQIVRAKAITRGTVLLAERMLADGYSNRFTAEQLLDKAVSGLLELQEGSLRSPLAS